MKIVELMKLIEGTNDTLSVSFTLFSDGSGYIEFTPDSRLNFVNEIEMQNILNSIYVDYITGKINFEL